MVVSSANIIGSWTLQRWAQAKTDETALPTYVKRPIPSFFLRFSSLKWSERTFVESETEKCFPSSLRTACSHCSLKCSSIGILKNPTFSLFGPVDPFWSQRWTQQYRFCGVWLLFIMKKATNFNKITFLARTIHWRRSVSFQLYPRPPRFHVLVPRPTRAVLRRAASQLNVM